MKPTLQKFYGNEPVPTHIRITPNSPANMIEVIVSELRGTALVDVTKITIMTYGGQYNISKVEDLQNGIVSQFMYKTGYVLYAIWRTKGGYWTSQINNIIANTADIVPIAPPVFGDATPVKFTSYSDLLKQAAAMEIPIAAQNTIRQAKTAAGDLTFHFSYTLSDYKGYKVVITNPNAVVGGLSRMEFVIARDGSVNPQSLQLTYRGATSDLKPEGQLLYNAAKYLMQPIALPGTSAPSAVEILKVVLQIKVSSIDQFKGIYCEINGNHLRVYADANGGMQMEAIDRLPVAPAGATVKFADGVLESLNYGPAGRLLSNVYGDISDLLTRLAVTNISVTVTAAQQVTWNDGCLGWPTDGGCTMALVEGSKVILNVNGVSYEYHHAASLGAGILDPHVMEGQLRAQLLAQITSYNQAATVYMARLKEQLQFLVRIPAVVSAQELEAILAGSGLTDAEKDRYQKLLTVFTVLQELDRAVIEGREVPADLIPSWFESFLASEYPNLLIMIMVPRILANPEQMTTEVLNAAVAEIRTMMGNQTTEAFFNQEIVKVSQGVEAQRSVLIQINQRFDELKVRTRNDKLVLITNYNQAATVYMARLKEQLQFLVRIPAVVSAQELEAILAGSGLTDAEKDRYQKLLTVFTVLQELDRAVIEGREVPSNLIPGWFDAFLASEYPSLSIMIMVPRILANPAQMTTEALNAAVVEIKKMIGTQTPEAFFAQEIVKMSQQVEAQRSVLIQINQRFEDLKKKFPPEVKVAVETDLISTFGLSTLDRVQIKFESQSNVFSVIVTLPDGMARSWYARSITDPLGSSELPSSIRYVISKSNVGGVENSYYLMSGEYEIGTKFYQLTYTNNPDGTNNQLHSVQVYDTNPSLTDRTVINCFRAPCPSGKSIKHLTYAYGPIFRGGYGWAGVTVDIDYENANGGIPKRTVEMLKDSSSKQCYYLETVYDYDISGDRSIMSDFSHGPLIVRYDLFNEQWISSITARYATSDNAAVIKVGVIEYPVTYTTLEDLLESARPLEKVLAFVNQLKKPLSEGGLGDGFKIDITALPRDPVHAGTPTYQITVTDIKNYLVPPTSGLKQVSFGLTDAGGVSCDSADSCKGNDLTAAYYGPQGDIVVKSGYGYGLFQAIKLLKPGATQAQSVGLLNQIQVVRVFDEPTIAILFTFNKITYKFGFLGQGSSMYLVPMLQAPADAIVFPSTLKHYDAQGVLLREIDMDASGKIVDVRTPDRNRSSELPAKVVVYPQGSTTSYSVIYYDAQGNPTVEHEIIMPDGTVLNIRELSKNQMLEVVSTQVNTADRAAAIAAINALPATAAFYRTQVMRNGVVEDVQYECAPAKRDFTKQPQAMMLVKDTLLPNPGLVQVYAANSTVPFFESKMFFGQNGFLLSVNSIENTQITPAPVAALIKTSNLNGNRYADIYLDPRGNVTKIVYYQYNWSSLPMLKVPSDAVPSQTPYTMKHYGANGVLLREFDIDMKGQIIGMTVYGNVPMTQLPTKVGVFLLRSTVPFSEIYYDAQGNVTRVIFSQKNPDGSIIEIQKVYLKNATYFGKTGDWVQVTTRTLPLIPGISTPTEYSMELAVSDGSVYVARQLSSNFMEIPGISQFSIEIKDPAFSIPGITGGDGWIKVMKDLSSTFGNVSGRSEYLRQYTAGAKVYQISGYSSDFAGGVLEYSIQENDLSFSIPGITGGDGWTKISMGLSATFGNVAGVSEYLRQYTSGAMVFEISNYTPAFGGTDLKYSMQVKDPAFSVAGITGGDGWIKVSKDLSSTFGNVAGRSEYLRQYKNGATTYMISNYTPAFGGTDLLYTRQEKKLGTETFNGATLASIFGAPPAGKIWGDFYFFTTWNNGFTGTPVFQRYQVQTTDKTVTRILLMDGTVLDIRELSKNEMMEAVSAQLNSADRTVAIAAINALPATAAFYRTQVMRNGVVEDVQYECAPAKRDFTKQPQAMMLVKDTLLPNPGLVQVYAANSTVPFFESKMFFGQNGFLLSVNSIENTQIAPPPVAALIKTSNLNGNRYADIYLDPRGNVTKIVYYQYDWSSLPRLFAPEGSMIFPSTLKGYDLQGNLIHEFSMDPNGQVLSITVYGQHAVTELPVKVEVYTVAGVLYSTLTYDEQGQLIDAVVEPSSGVKAFVTQLQQQLNPLNGGFTVHAPVFSEDTGNWSIQVTAPDTVTAGQLQDMTIVVSPEGVIQTVSANYAGQNWDSGGWNLGKTLFDVLPLIKKTSDVEPTVQDFVDMANIRVTNTFVNPYYYENSLHWSYFKVEFEFKGKHYLGEGSWTSYAQPNEFKLGLENPESEAGRALHETLGSDYQVQETIHIPDYVPGNRIPLANYSIDDYVSYLSSNPISNGRFLQIHVNVDAESNIFWVDVSYANQNWVDGMLLFEVLSRRTSATQALKDMTKLTVTYVDGLGTIHLALDGRNYLAFRGSDDQIAQLIPVPAVVETLRAAAGDQYDLRFDYSPDGRVIINLNYHMDENLPPSQGQLVAMYVDTDTAGSINFVDAGYEVYTNGDPVWVNGMALFEALSHWDTASSPMRVLTDITRLTVTSVTDPDRIRFTLDGTRYMTYRDADGNMRMQEYIPLQTPTVNAVPAVVTEPGVTLSGTTRPGTEVCATLNGDNYPYCFSTEADGTWSGWINLTTGANTISILARDLTTGAENNTLPPLHITYTPLAEVTSVTGVSGHWTVNFNYSESGVYQLQRSADGNVWGAVTQGFVAFNAGTGIGSASFVDPLAMQANSYRVVLTQPVQAPVITAVTGTSISYQYFEPGSYQLQQCVGGTGASCTNGSWANVGAPQVKTDTGTGIFTDPVGTIGRSYRVVLLPVPVPLPTVNVVPAVVTQSEVTLSGTSKPGTEVCATLNGDSYANCFYTGEDGTWTGLIYLTAESNSISILARDLTTGVESNVLPPLHIKYAPLPVVTSLNKTPEGWRVNFNYFQSGMYQLQRSTDLNTWVDVAGAAVAVIDGTGSTFLVDPAATAASAFYRVVLITSGVAPASLTVDSSDNAVA